MGTLLDCRDRSQKHDPHIDQNHGQCHSCDHNKEQTHVTNLKPISPKEIPCSSQDFRPFATFVIASRVISTSSSVWAAERYQSPLADCQIRTPSSNKASQNLEYSWLFSRNVSR